MTKKNDKQPESVENLHDSESEFLRFQPKTKRDKALLEMVNRRLHELADLDPEYAESMKNMMKKAMGDVQAVIGAQAVAKAAEAASVATPEPEPEPVAEPEPEVQPEPEPVVEPEPEVQPEPEPEPEVVSEPEVAPETIEEVVSEEASAVEELIDDVAADIMSHADKGQDFAQEAAETAAEKAAFIDETASSVQEEVQESVEEAAAPLFAEESRIETPAEEEQTDDAEDAGTGYPYDELEDPNDSKTGLAKKIIYYLIFLAFLAIAVIFFLKKCTSYKEENSCPDDAVIEVTRDTDPVAEAQQEADAKPAEQEQAKQEADKKAYDMKIEYSSDEAAQSAHAAAKKADKVKADEAKKAEAKKAESKKSDAQKTDVKKADSKKASTTKTGQKKASSTKTAATTTPKEQSANTTKQSSSTKATNTKKTQSKATTSTNTSTSGEKVVTNDLTALESERDKEPRICTPDKVPTSGYVISYSSPKNEATAIKTVMILSRQHNLPSGYYWLGDSKTQAKKKLYRVYVGPYNTEADAEAALSTVKSLAPDAKVYSEAGK